MTPSIGRIVHYVLGELDCAQINRRRTTGDAIRDRIKIAAWPLGAQAHVGHNVVAGETFPMLIVRVFESGAVNGRVFLDGSDDLWVTSVDQVDARESHANKHGLWFEPPRV